MQLLVNCF